MVGQNYEFYRYFYKEEENSPPSLKLRWTTGGVGEEETEKWRENPCYSVSSVVEKKNYIVHKV